MEEGGTVSVSLNNIKATDMDSSVAHLTVHIKVGPSFGRIVSTRTSMEFYSKMFSIEI